MKNYGLFSGLYIHMLIKYNKKTTTTESDFRQKVTTIYNDIYKKNYKVK